MPRLVVPTRTPATGQPRRRGPLVRRLDSPVAAWVFFLLLAAVPAIAAARSYAEAVALRDRGVVATASVVRQGPGRGEHVVEFPAADGRRVRASVEGLSRPPAHVPKPGDTVRVVYDPRRPSSYAAPAATGPDYSNAWVCGGAAVFFGVVAPLVVTGRIWRS